MTINFDTTKDETTIIIKIAKRASDLAKKHGLEIEGVDFLMDVSATHASGCPLNLQNLLNADDENFSHDVFGIRRHLDRETGILGDCFLPRHATPQ